MVYGSGYDSGNSLAQNIEMDKVMLIIRKSIIFILIIFSLSLFASYLYLRYTKSVYQSNSVIKLTIKSEASALGFNTFSEEMVLDNISSEIEIIKSKLFLGQVMEIIDYDVSYYAYGDILYEERYGNAPIEVQYTSLDPSLYDRRFKIELLNESFFKLEFSEQGKTVVKKFKYGQPVKTASFNFVIKKTPYFLRDPNRKLFFIINSDGALFDYFSRNLLVAPLNFNANTITISLKDHNPRKAREFVMAIDTLYLSFSQNEKLKAIKQKIQFLDQQLEATERRLDRFEGYFENFTIENRTTDFQQDMKATIDVLVALDSQQISLNNRLSNINETNSAIIGQEEEKLVLKSAGNNALFNQLIGQYNELQRDLQLLGESYKEKSLVIRKKELELELIKEELLDYLENAREKLYEQLKNIAAQRDKIESDFESQPSKRTQLEKAQRYYNLYESFYLTLMQKKAEFEISRAGTVPEFKILSPASAPSIPIFPKKYMVYAFGIVAGAILSFLFVGARLLMHNKISSVTELERISDLPVLGAIPRYSKGKLEISRLLVNKGLKSSLSESFRNIRTNLDFITANGNPNLIAVSSFVSGEGKTFVSVNLAAIISLSGKKVIILDADMRKPRLHKVFDVEENLPGLSTLLINKSSIENCILHSEMNNLDFITAGPVPPNPSELIIMQEFKLLINQLRNIYDVIIIDTPPIGLVTDPILIMKHTMVNICVFRNEFSKRSFVRSFNKIYHNNKLKNIGLVLNDVKLSRSGADYKYGYGTGYYEDDQSQEKKGFFKKILNR